MDNQGSIGPSRKNIGVWAHVLKPPKPEIYPPGAVEALWRAKMGILETWSCTGEGWALGKRPE